MRAIDALHLEYPFSGSRMLQGLLLAEGQDTVLEGLLPALDLALGLGMAG